MAQMYFVERREDNHVAGHELWYTNVEYHSMTLAIEEHVLQARAHALAGVPLNYAGDDDAAADEDSVCCVGIEHLLTDDVMLEMEACRARCIQAVLAEQARQDASEMDIALASLAQTRKVALRARKLGKLHHEAI